MRNTSAMRPLKRLTIPLVWEPLGLDEAEFDGVSGADPIIGVGTGGMAFAGSPEAVGKLLTIIREE